MKRLLLAAAVALATPCAASAQQAPSQIAQAIPAIDRIFADWRLDAHAPGLVYGIVAGGRLVHVGTSGVQELEARRPVTADSLFRIASMTKAFTALSILRLRDEGRLPLYALAETYVPSMSLVRIRFGWPRIRVRDRLIHTAGFVTDPMGDHQQLLSEPEFTAMIRRGVPFTRAPGPATNIRLRLSCSADRQNVSGRPYRTFVEPISSSLAWSERLRFVRGADERSAIGYRWENAAWRESRRCARRLLAMAASDQRERLGHWSPFCFPPAVARRGRDRPARRQVRELAQGLNFPSLATSRAARAAGAGKPRPTAWACGSLWIARSG